MTVQEFLLELQKVEDKDLEMYVNVHGREYWISGISYVTFELCFSTEEDFQWGDELE